VNHELWQERFREHLEIRGRAARTVQTYQDVLSPFLEFLAQLWNCFGCQTGGDGRAAGTVTVRDVQLKRFFRFCASHDLALDQVTDETGRAFHLHLLDVPGHKGRCWTPAFVLATLRSLESFWEWARERRLVMTSLTLAEPLRSRLRPCRPS